MIKRFIAIATLPAAILAAPAGAAVLDSFTFTSSVFDLSFTLPASPTPTLAIDAIGFTVPATGTFNGSPAEFPNLTFYNGFDGFAGGFDYDSTSPMFLDGPQVYSGSEDDPTFVPGSYALGNGIVAGNLVIAAVPEPSVWALMVTGFVAVGFAMRNARRRSFAISG